MKAFEGTYFGDRRTAAERKEENLKMAREFVDNTPPLKVELVFDLKSGPLIIEHEVKAEIIENYSYRSGDSSAVYVLTPDKSVERMINKMIDQTWFVLPGRQIRSNRFVEVRFPEGLDMTLNEVYKDDDSY